MKLEEANKMSMQELMDYSISKLVAQGCQARIGNSCAYGNSQGHHCAIGWLLDEDNKELMEVAASVGTIVATFSNHIPIAIKENLLQFERFQSLHDEDCKFCRKRTCEKLANICVDVSTNIDWQKWVEMGRDTNASIYSFGWWCVCDH